MLNIFLKSGVFFLIAGVLGLGGCGKKSSSNSPAPPSTDWDGLSDRNASDLTLKDIDP